MAKRKRVSCRVVESTALTEISSSLSHAGQSNNELYKIGEIAAVNVRAGNARNSVTYTHWLNIVRASINDGLTGLILDCYA